MQENINQRLAESELNYFNTQIKNERINRWYYLFRMPAIIIGFFFTVFIYWRVTEPQAERERIRLYIEVLDKKPEVRDAAIDLIRQAFPTDNAKFLNKEKIFIDAVAEEDIGTLLRLKSKAEESLKSSNSETESEAIRENIRELERKIENNRKR